MTSEGTSDFTFGGVSSGSSGAHAAPVVAGGESSANESSVSDQSTRLAAAATEAVLALGHIPCAPVLEQMAATGAAGGSPRALASPARSPRPTLGGGSLRTLTLMTGTDAMDSTSYRKSPRGSATPHGDDRSPKAQAIGEGVRTGVGTPPPGLTSVDPASSPPGLPVPAPRDGYYTPPSDYGGTGDDPRRASRKMEAALEDRPRVKPRREAPQSPRIVGAIAINTPTSTIAAPSQGASSADSATKDFVKVMSADESLANAVAQLIKENDALSVGKESPSGSECRALEGAASAVRSEYSAAEASASTARAGYQAEEASATAAWAQASVAEAKMQKGRVCDRRHGGGSSRVPSRGNSK